MMPDRLLSPSRAMNKYSFGTNNPFSYSVGSGRLFQHIEKLIERYIKGNAHKAADEGELIRVLGHAPDVLRDLHAGDIGLDGRIGAADLGGRGGFHVPGVELRRAADEEQHDPILSALAGSVDARGLDFRRER